MLTLSNFRAKLHNRILINFRSLILPSFTLALFPISYFQFYVFSILPFENIKYPRVSNKVLDTCSFGKMRGVHIYVNRNQEVWFDFGTKKSFYQKKLNTKILIDEIDKLKAPSAMIPITWHFDQHLTFGVLSPLIKNYCRTTHSVMNQFRLIDIFSTPNPQRVLDSYYWHLNYKQSDIMMKQPE